MKLHMIVLRETKKDSPDFVLMAAKPKGQKSEVQGLALGFEETKNADDRRKLRSAKGVVAVAPRMPLTLIKSITTAQSANKKAPKTSWGIAAVNAAKSKLDGSGITVAVLDTGIDPTHPAFRTFEVGKTLLRENFTEESPEDLEGHGTHCAGTIFGQDVDGHRIGIARGISKVLIGKVIGKEGGSTESIVRAISWAQKEGAHVISMSLGMDFVALQKELVEENHLPVEQATSVALAAYRDNVRLFDKISESTSGRAAMAGSAVVVAAAGNESNRPDYSITVAPPAAAEFFLSISAIRKRDGKAGFEMASFSNDGGIFAAPGEDIWSASLDGSLASADGTSMATPHAAGVAALWAQKLLASKKDFRAAEVIDEMMRSSLRLTPGIPDSDSRYGLVQAPLS